METKLKNFNKSFLILAFLGAITVGMFSFVFIKLYPTYADRVSNFCRRVLTLSSVSAFPKIFSQVLIFSISLIILLGFLSIFSQVWKTIYLLLPLLSKRVDIPSDLHKIVRRIGLEKKVVLVDSEKVLSFCYGFFFPKILISTSIVSALNDNEIEAVLIHENAHRKNKDNLKMLLGNIMVRMFFFMPVFAELNKNVAVTNEIIADRRVIRYQGSDLHLRSALRKLLSSSFTIASYPNFSEAYNPDYLETRVAHIIDPKIKQSSGISMVGFWVTLIVLLFGLIILFSPVKAFEGKDTSSKTSYPSCSKSAECKSGCKDVSGNNYSDSADGNYIPRSWPR